MMVLVSFVGGFLLGKGLFIIKEDRKTSVVYISLGGIVILLASIWSFFI